MYVECSNHIHTIWGCETQLGLYVVSFPDPTTHARNGSGDIGADSWFCKLSNHVIICIGLYWRTCGHVMVRKTKKTFQCPQTLFLTCVVGSGNEIRLYVVMAHECIIPVSLCRGVTVFNWLLSTFALAL